MTAEFIILRNGVIQSVKDELENVEEGITTTTEFVDRLVVLCDSYYKIKMNTMIDNIQETCRRYKKCDKCYSNNDGGLWCYGCDKSVR